MQRITFKGGETEFHVYAQMGIHATLAHALEARGYSVEVQDGVNPWAENEEMVAVSGKLAPSRDGCLLYLAPTHEVATAIYDTIQVSFPEADVSRMLLKRPA